MRRALRPRVRSLKLRPRPLTPIVDHLETRELLSTLPAGPTATAVAPGGYPTYEAIAQAASLPPSSALSPAQVQQAYGFNKVAFGSVHGDGSGETIAIIDAYDDPNIQADLNTFSAQFGLPATTVTRVGQNGGSVPATDPSGGWETEEALDVEWAHAIAPAAKILLVEANSTNLSDLIAGVDYASTQANVVSMSWGGGEFAGEDQSSIDGHFVHAGVVYVASSGDSGAPISWPAASPNVLSVGGTALSLASGSTWAGETGWSGSGGGPSAYEAQPSYQAGVVTQATTRANPDVAYDASPSTGFAVYDSFATSNGVPGWMQVGGTSAGAPQWAALVAIADQGRALSGLPALNSTNPQEVLTTLYQGAGSAEFHDVTSGGSTGSPAYSAGPGYDYVTGLGSPVANLVVQSLVGVPTSPPSSSDHLAIAAPASGMAGNALTVTVTDDDASGAADTGYRGTVAFSSSDVQAGLPASYTFTAADAGAHTFTLTLKTAGAQSVSVADTTSSNVAAASSSIAVSPAAPSQIVLAGLPASATVGAPVTFTVTLKDPYGNVATNYGGTVHFSSSDAQAALPADTTFAAADAGRKSFSLTFGTTGNQTVTVSDSALGLSTTSAGTSVAPAAPVSLAASAASSSQINLSWTGSAGSSGYLVERSANGSSGWTQIGSTPAGTTSYQDTGLAAGTTYYYRVRASGLGTSSAYSNTASATTTGSAPAAPGGTSLWSNSYTPPVDSYSWGSYELGVKFRTDVPGTVTALRFYKQSWMGGYTHVGHLWTSTGTLLASATFTGETASGWEQVTLSQPVSVSANTVYIVSFSSGGGYFGISTSYFNSQGVDSGSLHALANGVSGGDGVYQSGNGSFPSVSGNGMNFWADVVFNPTTTVSAATATPTATTTTTSRTRTTPWSSAFIAPAPAAAPSSTASATRTQISRTAAVTVTGSWPYRGTVPQTRSFRSSRERSSVFFGLHGV